MTWNTCTIETNVKKHGAIDFVQDVSMISLRNLITVVTLWWYLENQKSEHKKVYLKTKTNKLLK